MLRHTLEAFTAHPRIDAVLTVISQADRDLYEDATRDMNNGLLAPAIGGDTRQASVLAGLNALREIAPKKVLIHDAARPFVSAAIISRVLESLERHDACVAALPVADTLKRAVGNVVERTVDRSRLWRAQTPQGFDYEAILDAHEQASTNETASFTDDASIAEWAGLKVALVEGSAENWKITTAEDLAMAEKLIATENRANHVQRTGTGFDVHAFTDGDHVMLCGVRIPHGRSLKGHSDADVDLHALTDALLGAIGAGDIGAYFPPSDPQWRAAPSRIFLERAGELIDQQGGCIVNVDVTLICQEPKVGPHREPMREAIAGILGIGVEQVSVKATTTEGLGFTGRGEGIAAMASASVMLPTGK